MPPERMIQNSILHEIKRWGDIITQQKELEPVKDAKKWNSSNDSDWRYGHFIGMIEGLAILYHHVMHHRQITPNELNEIEKFIHENTKDLRNYFYSINT